VRLAVGLFVVTIAAVGACSSSSTNAAATGGAAGSSTGGNNTGGGNTGGSGNTDGGSTGGGNTGGSAGAAGGGGMAGGGASDAGLQCPTAGKKGAALINAGAFCVDATEVTNGDYDAFLKDTASKPTPPPACAANDLNPATDTTTGCPTFQLDSAPKLPVVCVDWCDAQAYCAWAGKRLCGAISGTPVLPSQANDPNVSEWYAACTGAPKGGKDWFFYGDHYVAGRCAGDGASIAQVKQYPDCHSYYFPALFDMSGNVSEWEDACTDLTASNANCLVRGGSFYSTEPDLRCDANKPADRMSYSADRGFRCCWDPSIP